MTEKWTDEWAAEEVKKLSYANESEIRVDRMAPFFQGDLAIVPIDEIPSDATRVEAKEGRYVLQHSETGHDHTGLEAEMEVFTRGDAFVGFILATTEARIQHHRTDRPHKTWIMPPGAYQFIRQSEYTPEGERMVQD